MVHKHFLIFYGFPLHCVDTIYIYSFSRKGGRPWVAPVLVFKRAEETLEAAPWYPAHWVASWVASFGLNCRMCVNTGTSIGGNLEETLRKPILYLLQ